jgi:hypothetical protein
MKKVTKIVTFYDDGTFSEAVPVTEPVNVPRQPPTFTPDHQPWNPSMPYQPIQPKNPYGPSYPWEPPYTIWCKTADGTVQEMTLTSPIVAQTTGDTNV